MQYMQPESNPAMSTPTAHIIGEMWENSILVENLGLKSINLTYEILCNTSE